MFVFCIDEILLVKGTLIHVFDLLILFSGSEVVLDPFSFFKNGFFKKKHTNT